MRTKTLLLTAALCAAGAATSMAQVYSVNMVGYINQSIPAGFSMIANQLNASPDNKVTTLLPAPPNGTSVFKFNKASGGFDQLDYFGGWEGDNLDLTLGPGEGAFIRAPSAFTTTFVGEVALSSTIQLEQGFQIISSALPQSLPLTAPTAGAANLEFPVVNGDEVFQYDPVGGGFRVNSYFGGWEGDNEGVPPTPAIGESFFFRRAAASGPNWSRTFAVGN
jgi:hypothetical protein